MVNYELYRRSTLGICLTDTLDELIQESRITPQTALAILSMFDTAIAQALHKVKYKLSVKGKLNTYRFCDDVWTFLVDQPNFKLDSEFLVADRIKVVACSAKPPSTPGNGASVPVTSSSTLAHVAGGESGAADVDK